MLLFLPFALARAEVLDAGATGFTSRHSVIVGADATTAWTQLLAISDWWSGAHTYSGDPANLVLASSIGGCFCEHWAGGSVEHLRVVAVQPGKLLRLRGGLGPLQSLGVDGALTIEFAPVAAETGSAAAAGAAGGTKVTFTYAVAGYSKDGLTGWAAPVDGVLGEQVQRFGARFAR